MKILVYTDKCITPCDGKDRLDHLVLAQVGDALSTEHYCGQNWRLMHAQADMASFVSMKWGSRSLSSPLCELNLWQATLCAFKSPIELARHQLLTQLALLGSHWRTPRCRRLVAPRC